MPWSRDAGDLREAVWMAGRLPAQAQSWAVAFVGLAFSALWGTKLIWGVPRHPLSSEPSEALQ